MVIYPRLKLLTEEGRNPTVREGAHTFFDSSTAGTIAPSLTVGFFCNAPACPLHADDV